MESSRIKKELNEKNKIYRSGRTIQPLLLLAGIILVYVFFFSSSMIISPPISDKESVTQIGAETEFAPNRTFSLVDVIYSPSQEMMEIVMQMNNNNYDNVNEYYYTIACDKEDTGKMDVKEIFNRELFTVVRISHLPSGYDELRLLFAPKTVAMENITDDITGVVTLNMHNVKEAKINTSKTENEYYMDRLNGIKKDTESDIKSYEKRLAELKMTADAIIAEKKTLEENRKYMTSDEIAEKEEAIIQNEQSMLDNKKEQYDVQFSIEELNKKLAEVSQKMSDIGQGK